MMEFREVVPRLANYYGRGLLVPFIGLGMSRPACSDWKGFVDSLASRAFGNVEEETSGQDLPRVADRAVRRLLASGELVDACKEALRGQSCEDPIQTRTLADLYWPLVITTNYDDWYPAYVSEFERRKRGVGFKQGEVLDILGRGQGDCEKVIRSLETFSNKRILWAIQGFLGGQAVRNGYCLEKLLRESRRRELASQIVVGHGHYQRAINHSRHFRRAFAQVFRTRSLLFLGSGLAEDYTVNLLGEVLEQYGANTYPHFLVKLEPSPAEVEFLETRLNVNVIPIQEYSQLPALLEQLGIEVRERQTTRSWSFHRRERSTVTIAERRIPEVGEIEAKDAWIAVSVGRSDANAPLPGSQARSVLASFGLGSVRPVAGYATLYELDADGRVIGVAARSDGDTRHLSSISSAMIELIGYVESQRVSEKACLHIGLLAAGPKRAWNPTFSLVQMLRGLRGAPSSIEVKIYIVDPSVRAVLRSGALRVEELLECSDMRIWLEVEFSDEQRESHLLLREEASLVQDLLGFEDSFGEGWTFEVFPSPSASFAAEEYSDIRTRTLEQVGVVPGSRVVLRGPVGEGEGE